MSHFLVEYGLFLLKVLTIAVAIIVVIGFAAAAGRKASQEGLEVENLNKKYESLAHSLKQAVLNRSDRKKEDKREKKRLKLEAKATSDRPRSFVIEFKGDLKASAVPSLRAEVSAVLDVAGPEDQVIVCLDNHGGVVL